MKHRALATLAPLLTAVGCARTMPVDRGAGDPCLIAPGLPADTITIGLTEPVDPARAPVPSSAAEDVLFGTLYETLVTVDCNGAVGPGLAESWTADAAGRTWTFRLRPGATFWDGTPVTASAVRDFLIEREAVAVAQAPDERTLVVSLSRQHRTPHVFADRRLALVGLATDLGWPAGTSHYRLDAADADRLIAAPRDAMGRDPLPVVEFVRGERDPRDLLDRGVDLVMTRAPGVLDYARRLPRYRVHPLRWDRVYVLAIPSRWRAEAAAPDPVLAEQLATDVIRADARPAQGPYWWSDPTACVPVRSGSTMHVTPLPRVVYPDGDPAARAIAERVVALLRGGELDDAIPVMDSLPRSALTAAAAPQSESDEWLEPPRAVAFVMALPADVVDACAAFERLQVRTKWIGPLAAAAVLLPLVETRSSLIIKNGVAGVALRWDGTPVVGAAYGGGR